MASMSSFTISPPNLFYAKTHLPIQSKLQTLNLPLSKGGNLLKLSYYNLSYKDSRTKLFAVAEETAVEKSSSVARRLYIGNIPRNVDNAQLAKIVEEHGAVEKAEVMYDKYSGRSRRFGFVTMKTVEDANAAIEKLNGTEIGGREIKVNITEKPLESVDLPVLDAQDSQFDDSPHKVYVGNLAKMVTSDTLKEFFSEKGKVLSAKVQRVPGTSKSSGFGFVSFSSEEDVKLPSHLSTMLYWKGKKSE